MGKKEHLYSKKLATKEPSPNLHSLSKMYFKENSEQLCAHLQKSKYRSIVLGKSGVLDKRVLQSGAFRFVNVGKRSEVGFTIHCVEEGIDTGRSIEWVQVKFQKVGSLTELLALVRFQGFKRFLQTTKSASLCFHKKRNQKVSLPILTFLKSGEFAENLIHAFEIL
jgi:hypothetical protein